MIRGSKQKITPIKNELNFNIHNRFDVEVRDTITGKVRQKACAFNVILNQCWNRLDQTDNFRYIWYGDGSGTPAETDTRMFGSQWKVEATADSTGFSWNTGVYYRRKRIQLAETAAVGVNISEAGVGSSSILCTHAMLQDMNGNPITILKTNTDIITIYATVYAHCNIRGYNGEKAWVYPYTLVADLSNLTITDIQSVHVSGGTGRYSTSTNWQYSAENRQITINNLRFGASYANFEGGIMCAFLSGRSGGSTPYPTLLATFSLEGAYSVDGEPVGTGDGTTTDFGLKFDLPKSARIYVDGIELTTGFEVFQLPKLQPHAYFVKIAPNSTPDNIVPIGLTPYYLIAESSPVYFYNPYYDFGIASVSKYSYLRKLEASNDLVNWVQISLSSSPSNIPAAYRHYKFWRTEVDTTFGGGSIIFTASTWSDDYAHADGKMLHFDTPPAAGAVITADYTCAFVPKDANHVFDFSCTISFGNYEGP